MNRREVKRAPVLRFKGFTNDWEQRKPGDFLVESKIIGHKGDKAKKLTVKLWGKGVQEKQDILSGSANTQYYIRKSGQLMYGKLDFLHAAFGIVPSQLNNYESTIDSPSFDVKSANSIFLLNLFLRKKFYLYYGERANGSRKAKRIHEKDFLVMPIKMPEINEQNKISNLIEIVNNRITLQQRKLSLIKTLKRSFLSDLFFKTSTNSIVITLKQVTSIRGGYAFKSKEFTENGYPIIKIANISNNGEIKGPYSYTNNFNKKYILTKNDIVLAMSGATTGKIAKLRSSKSFLQNQRIGYFCKTNNIDYNYLYYLLISDQFKKQLKRITIAGAQPNVSSLDIENFRFSVLSSKNKQKKISDFLNKLDIKIRITNKKITIFSQLKRSLLNNMFI